MGKATIIAPKGAGLYAVAINYDQAAYAARFAALTASLASLDSQLATLAAQISTAKGDKDYCLGLLNEAIAAKDLPYIKSTESELIKANAVWMGLRQTETIFKSRRLSASKALETLKATPPADRRVDAWCADASKSLSGVVGTIDPAGVDSNTLLRPGFSGQAAYAPARDGLYRQREHMGPAEVFYNAAMLPGWQKWTPTYRVGTITALTGDSCDVLLDPVVSDAHGLDVNQSPTLTGVGVDYMDCHGAAFAVGDTVVVMFTGQEWGNPQVIGFESNPKPCSRHGISHWSQEGKEAVWFGSTTDYEEAVVDKKQWISHGNQYWYGSNGEVLSWFGPNGRYSIGPEVYGGIHVGDVVCGRSSASAYPSPFGHTLLARVTNVTSESVYPIGTSSNALQSVAEIEDVPPRTVYRNGRAIKTIGGPGVITGAWYYKGFLITVKNDSFTDGVHGSVFEAHGGPDGESIQIGYVPHVFDVFGGDSQKVGGRYLTRWDNMIPWRASGDGSVAKTERFTHQAYQLDTQIFLTVELAGAIWGEIAVTFSQHSPTVTGSQQTTVFGDGSNSVDAPPQGHTISNSAAYSVELTDYFMDEVLTATITYFRSQGVTHTKYGGLNGAPFVEDGSDTIAMTIACSNGMNFEQSASKVWSWQIRAFPMHSQIAFDFVRDDIVALDLRFLSSLGRREQTTIQRSSSSSIVTPDPDLIYNDAGEPVFNPDGIDSAVYRSTEELHGSTTAHWWSQQGGAQVPIHDEGNTNIDFAWSSTGSWWEQVESGTKPSNQEREQLLDQVVTLSEGQFTEVAGLDNFVLDAPTFLFIENSRYIPDYEVLFSLPPYVVRSEEGLVAFCHKVWEKDPTGSSFSPSGVSAVIGGEGVSLAESPLPIGVI